MLISNVARTLSAPLFVVFSLVMLSGCKTVVQELDMERARAAGAKFSTRAAPPCLSNNRLARQPGPYGLDAPGGVMSVDCALGFLLSDTSGVKAEMGIYQDFELQNGWKIDRVDVLFDVAKNLDYVPVVRQVSDMFPTLQAAEAVDGSGGLHSFRWIHAPQVGGTRPTGFAALSANPSTYMRTYVRIMIRGREHTDPYVRITLPDPEVQVLSYARARAAGARFENNPLTAGTCPFLGQKDGATVLWAEAVHPGVTFWADCTQVLGSPPSLTGGKADPVAFGGFQLKNGWRIKSIHVVFPNEPHIDYMDDPAKAFRWLRKPEVGSDNPEMKVHIATSAATSMLANVKVLIEGPAGTDPYQ